MKIKHKLFVVFCLIAVLPLLLFSLLFYSAEKEHLRRQVTQHLISIASLQRNRLVEIIQQNTERFSLVSSRGLLRVSLDRYLRTGARKHVEKIIRIIKNAEETSPRIKAISVLTKDGKILASTADKPYRAHIHYSRKAFAKGLKAVSVDNFYTDADGRLMLLLSGPLELDGKLLGVLFIEIAPRDLLASLRNYAGLGDTGETIVAIQDEEGNGVFLAPTRFGGNAPMSMKISRDRRRCPFIQAFASRHRVRAEATDYRGERVFAVAEYVEPVNWVVLVKIDQSEANAPILVLRNYLVAVVGVLIGVVLIASLYLADLITRPVIKLTKVMRDISTGDFSKRAVTTGANDEISVMAASFNEMTDSLARARHALTEEKERLQTITENLPVVVFQLYAGPDGERGIRYASPRLGDIYGLDTTAAPEEIPRAFAANIHDEDKESFLESAATAIKRRAPWHWKGRYLPPDGTQIWTEIFASPVADGDSGGEVVYNGVLLDVTEITRLAEEHRKAEKLLQRAQKMEAIGMMAGGVAHDLNNILSGIINYPELLLLELPDGSPLRAPLETIKASGLRAAAIVSDLLTVARGSAAAKEVTDLNWLITDYLGSPELRRLRVDYPGIELRTDLDTNLLPVKCSATHVRKCLLNLIINACEAVKERGQVTIGTENRYIDRPIAGYDEVKKGEYAVLSVRDNGPGIPPEDIDHIFEPFYTKKVMGRSGTGLGLAVVWSAIHDHHGYINVTSDAGGACFELFFPACREEIDGTAEETESLDDLRGNGETILVVDDEQTQRRIAVSLLNKLGYRAVAVKSGEEAVAYVREQDVDLILLDMIMDPGINGRETYERIVALKPGQKALIASGFSETAEVARAQALGVGAFVRKPYTLAQLGRAVKKELAGQQSQELARKGAKQE